MGDYVKTSLNKKSDIQSLFDEFDVEKIVPTICRPVLGSDYQFIVDTELLDIHKEEILKMIDD